jgi:hypothetical protein
MEVLLGEIGVGGFHEEYLKKIVCKGFMIIFKNYYFVMRTEERRRKMKRKKMKI